MKWKNAGFIKMDMRNGAFHSKNLKFIRLGNLDLDVALDLEMVERIYQIRLDTGDRFQRE